MTSLTTPSPITALRIAPLPCPVDMTSNCGTEK